MSDFEAAWKALVSGETRSWWSPAARGGLGILSGVYGGVVGTYRTGYTLGLMKTTRLPAFTVTVGNMTVGGTGKTTTVRWLARRLQEWGHQPVILSYGYRAGEGNDGRKSDKNTVTVVAGPEGIRQPVTVSGDEPQLLARSLPGVPVLIGKRRIRSGKVACEQFSPDVCILDDAFQYWRLEKDLEIVLINATEPFGFDRLLPRGTLREPLTGLRRAHAAILTHAAWVDKARRDEIRARLLSIHPGLVYAEARHVPVRFRDHHSGEVFPLESVAGQGWAALSSLGSPESFERTLKGLGVDPVSPERFRDHHPYAEEEIRSVARRVTGQGLSGLLTTEKDSVKIPSGWLDGIRCLVLEIDLEFLSGQASLESLVKDRLMQHLSARNGSHGEPSSTHRATGVGA